MRRAWFLLACLIGLAGCDTRSADTAQSGASGGQDASRAAMSPPAVAPSDDSSEVVTRTDYYRLTAPADRAADARRLAEMLQVAIERLKLDYAAVDADALLRAASVEIRIAGAPNEYCGVGTATSITSWDGAKCTMTIHLLAPSSHPDPAAPNAPRTIAGEPHDAEYCERTLVHEYSTLLLESLTRARPRGWRFHDAPAWFVQGAEEFLGLTYSNERARTRTLPAYIRMTREQQLVTNDFGLEARSPYVSGATLLAFVHERFGRERFISILRSEEATFGRALRSALRTTPDEFFAAFHAWLENR